MEREKFLTKISHSPFLGRFLGGKCSIAVLKDPQNGDYHLGCSECERPIKVNSSGKVNLKIKQKASPNC